MNSNKNVIVNFDLLASQKSEPSAGPYSLAWTMQLDVPDAVGQVVFGGQTVQVTRGPVQAAATARPGENVVEAQLIEAAGEPGSWRFEVEGGSVEPGSLRVSSGEVLLVTPTSMAFRLKGQRGEKVAFTYRLRP